VSLRGVKISASSKALRESVEVNSRDGDERRRISHDQTGIRSNIRGFCGEANCGTSSSPSLI